MRTRSFLLAGLAAVALAAGSVTAIAVATSFGQPTAAAGAPGQAVPTPSLHMIDVLGIAPTARVIDVGGGAASLVDQLHFRLSTARPSAHAERCDAS